MSDEATTKTDEETPKKGRKRTQVDLDKTVPTQPAPADPIHPGGAPPPTKGTYVEDPVGFTCPVCLKKVAIDVAVRNTESRPCHKECLDNPPATLPEWPPFGPIVPPSVPQTKEQIMSQMTPVESVLVEDGETSSEEPFRKADIKASRFKAKMISTIEGKIEALEVEQADHLLKAESLSAKIDALKKTLEVFSEPEQ